MAPKPRKWIMQFCTACRFKDGNQLFKCECCRQESRDVFMNDCDGMMVHLYKQHKKSEITSYPKFASIAEKFNINRNEDTEVGICFDPDCGMKVTSEFGRAFPFSNHIIMHHTEKKDFFAKAVGIVSGTKILNNYKIKDIINAKCSRCLKLFSLEDLDSHPAEVLVRLSKHWDEHAGDVPEILLDKASIQRELKDMEEKSLEANKKKQSIHEEVEMESALKRIEMEVDSEELDTLLQRYNMKLTKNSIIRCCVKKCRSQITLDTNKLYHIRNHWETFHGPKNNIYKELRKYKIIRMLLNEYIITDGTLATCPNSEYSINLENNTHDKLIELQERLHNERYETKYFLNMSKRAEVNFVCLFYFYNLIIIRR
ncbi:hypothetical protein ALC60_06434 [Trachymyrmex zeteki]|uniref:Uncharacterized protein n=1 Tax=Mycetomoellerius zeteki TaxID=64791 RepID=A0A151X2M6_9HYME|nr:hypothetical protein ALC60_06434 [Trachymyrmex zeteki]